MAGRVKGAFDWITTVPHHPGPGASVIRDGCAEVVARRLAKVCGRTQLPVRVRGSGPTDCIATRLHWPLLLSQMRY
jgi:hypothetical protein